MKTNFLTLSILLVLLLSIFSCEKELQMNTETAVLESTETQKEFVIFKELQEFIPENFDPKNEKHIQLLLAEVTPSLRTKLEESTVIVNYLEVKELVKNHVELFGEDIPTVDAVKHLLRDNQITELSNLIDAESADRAKCWNSCTQVGWYYCHPCYCVTCPIIECNFYCSTNTVVLWEGNNATQDIVAEIDVHYNRNINFTSSGCCQNDEARSATLFHMKAGQRIALFDDSNPTHWWSDDKDDYMFVQVLQDFTSFTIGTFENDLNNSFLRANYSCFKADHQNQPDSRCGNLDGKVSRFRSGN